MLDAALPLQHRPARIVVLRHLAEDRLEIDLPIAQRAEASCAIDPILVAAIHARPSVGPELRILHMKRAHPIVIEVQELQIIQLLQNHVARVVENIRALVIVHHFQKSLERYAVMQVLARMQLVANIHARFIEYDSGSESIDVPSSSNAASINPAGRCGHG